MVSRATTQGVVVHVVGGVYYAQHQRTHILTHKGGLPVGCKPIHVYMPAAQVGLS